jgi:hypothetical protein
MGIAEYCRLFYSGPPAARERTFILSRGSPGVYLVA